MIPKAKEKNVYITYVKRISKKSNWSLHVILEPITLSKKNVMQSRNRTMTSAANLKNGECKIQTKQKKKKKENLSQVSIETVPILMKKDGCVQTA